MKLDKRNPNHHIWCNNGTYFVHVTLVWNGRWKQRVRTSLRTRNVVEARRRRDRFLSLLHRNPGLTLSSRARCAVECHP